MRSNRRFADSVPYHKGNGGKAEKDKEAISPKWGSRAKHMDSLKSRVLMRAFHNKAHTWTFQSLTDIRDSVPPVLDLLKRRRLRIHQQRRRHPARKGEPPLHPFKRSQEERRLFGRTKERLGRP
jgi:hypothetical protein